VTENFSRRNGTAEKIRDKILRISWSGYAEGRHGTELLILCVKLLINQMTFPMVNNYLGVEYLTELIYLVAILLHVSCSKELMA
jgi:hypothetical protein